MSTRMIEALAALQAGEVRREASECRCQARLAPQRAGAAQRRTRLRRRIGFALIEAGCQLLATARPLRHD